jgi:hypothetical protein
MDNLGKDQLAGRWVTDPTDQSSLQEYGQATLEFLPDGRLFYTIYRDDKEEVMLLTYVIEGDILITDQPSSPRRRRTPFLLTPDGKLVLIYEGYQSFYLRDD